MSALVRAGWSIAALGGLALAITFVVVATPASGVAGFAAVRDRYTPSDAWLIDRHGEVLDRERLDFGVRRLEWVALEDISPALVAAVVEGEDRRFHQHGGVDWPGVAGALRDRLLEGRRRGASTITMQVAALVDGRAGRSAGVPDWRRKLAQVRVARALERGWSKREILEAYLNLLGFRGELQGIGAAAELLAGKAPSGLDDAESLVLAALLPAPGADLERVAARACARAAAGGVRSTCPSIRATAAAMLSRSVPAAPAPDLAPQVARQLLARPGERVRSTLDAGVQRAAATILRRHLAGLDGRNVRDGAVLVVDNASGDVLAYVGSGGPGSRAAQVDGVLARRQAGSTLKPFLYALALEQRYLTPASLLDDSPVNLDTASGIYLPQNYDNAFRGPVSVRTALGSSLNIPAVRTLVLVGVEAFRDRLRALGYEGLVHDGHYYGYALALGSAEVSLWEQAQAYRVLARGGRFSPLGLSADRPASPDREVLPAGATFLTVDILGDRAARAVTFGLESHLNTPFWSAVKTGTSKDMRDNWCIGFSDRYTTAVWVGNFEGDAMHDVSGVTGAAPVWQEIMLALDQAGASAPEAPPGVEALVTHFDPPVEAPRREWFLAGTGIEQVAALAPGGGIARITSPANGMVIALDPDIPPARQRVPFEAEGAADSMVLRLDDEVVGRAGGLHLWAPRTGAHRLALVDTDGRVVDRVLFTVR